MLKNMSKILTGDMLKVLCDMGHGDFVVLADANFPADTYAKRLIRCPGLHATDILEAVTELFPVDENYSDFPACVMDLTDSDKKKGMSIPEVWKDYTEIIQKSCEKEVVLGKIERNEFYEKTKDAYAVIQTGEERQYGNLLLVKGVVL